jgi:hypothetical protein
MFDKENPSFGTGPPAGQEFFGKPFIHSGDATGRKVRKRMHVSLADFTIKKSLLA